MRIEESVCSLELSKKLKEAGYPQEGCWWWTVLDDANRNREELIFRKDGGKLSAVGLESSIDDFFVAPTCAELMQILPATIPKNNHLQISKWRNSVGNCFFAVQYGVEFKDAQLNISLADVLAKMWLWLKRRWIFEERQ